MTTKAPRTKNTPEGEYKGFRPVDADAERAVLAAVLMSPGAFDEISGVLVPEDFGDERYQTVFSAMLSLDATGRPIDAVTVVDELRRAKKLSKVGGEEVVLALHQTAGDVLNVLAHADIVAEKSMLRRVVEAARSMAGAAVAPMAEARDVVAYAEEQVFAVSHNRMKSHVAPMAEAVPKLLAEVAKGRQQLLLGHSTGFPELDRLTGGLQAGQLVIVAARPGAGKSSFALQVARHIAETTGMLVPFLSYEMSQDELLFRMLASSLGYDMTKLRSGELLPGMDRDLSVQAERMAALQMLIDDNPPPAIAGVRSHLRRMARRGQIGAIVIDYLQLMDGDRRSRDANRAEEVSEVTRGLKRLAMELGVPVIALSQLNRQLENRPNKRPQLSDLRESGSLEQDASLVLFIYRDSLYNSAADPRSAELIIGKQRNGASGVSVPLEFHGPSTRFTPAGQAFTTPTGGSAQNAAGSRPF